MHIRLGLLATLAVCSTVSAQDRKDLDNILVTASRTPVERVSTGSAVSVITRQQIDDRQARYVSDLLRTVPGFTISQSGTTGSQTQVRVRGAEANHVLVLIDGVRANDPASGDEFRWELLSTSNIERIEIVRGPQSSLWGSDAVAAVVHVVTRAELRPTSIQAFVEGGSHDTQNAALNGSARSDSWAVAFGLETLNTDGTNISRTGSEDDGSDLTTASLSGQIKADDQLSLQFGARAVDSLSEFDPVDFFVTGLPQDANMAADARQLFLQAGGQFDSRSGRIRHHLNIRYYDTSNDTLADGVTTASTQADRTTYSYQTDFDVGENVLALAVEREETAFRQRGEVSFGDPNQDQEMSVNSVIVDYQGRLIDRLALLASARFDDNSDFDNALTGRLSLVYELSDTTRFRANLGTGRKAPTFIERYGFFPGQFVGNPNLKPEKSTSFDLGVERQFLDSNMNLQLTLFNQDLEDEINGFVFDPVTFLSTAENMTGDSSRTGAEFAVTWRVTEHLNFATSYTYTDSTEDDATGGKTRELRRPKHAGSISSTYRFIDNRANVTLIADYGGSQTDIFFPPFPNPSETVMLGASWLVDMTAGYDLTRKVNLFARVTNLLDEEYEQVYGYRGRERAGFVGVRVNFGE